MPKTFAKRTTQATTNAKRSKTSAARSGGGRMSSAVTGAVRPVVVPRPFSIPVQLKNTMNYVEVQNVTLSGGSARFYIAANAITTISVGAGAHKPLYFNQLMALYTRYHVLSSTIKVSYVATTGAAVSDAFTLSVFLDDDNVVSSVNALQERGTSRTSIVQSNAQTQRSIDPLTLTYSAAKMYGTTTMSNTSLQGTATTNPSDVMYYIISMQDQVAANSGNCIARVQVAYEVIFTDLVDVQQST